MKLIRHNYPLNPSVSNFSELFRDPFSDFEPLSRLFNVERVRDLLNSEPSFPADLYEDEEHYYARFELPGVEKKDLQVRVEVDGSLAVEVSHATNKDGEQKTVKASRRITLPAAAETEGINAKLENGILTVTLPKQEVRKPLAIDIQ